MGWSVAMYGAYQTEKVIRKKVPVYTWRRDGIIQRYHKWTRIRVIAEEKGRYEFYGRGRDLYQAIRIATEHPPNGYVDVKALDFIENPHEYCVSRARADGNVFCSLKTGTTKETPSLFPSFFSSVLKRDVLCVNEDII